MSKTYKELHAEFEGLRNDVERWRWVIDNQDIGITVFLDNDGVYATFDGDEGEDEDEEKFDLSFSGYIGWDDGAFSLLEAIGVKAEGV